MRTRSKNSELQKSINKEQLEQYGNIFYLCEDVLDLHADVDIISTTDRSGLKINCLILAAFSDLMKEVLVSQQEQPILILTDLTKEDITMVLDFLQFGRLPRPLVKIYEDPDPNEDRAFRSFGINLPALLSGLRKPPPPTKVDVNSKQMKDSKKPHFDPAAYPAITFSRSSDKLVSENKPALDIIPVPRHNLRPRDTIPEVKQEVDSDCDDDLAELMSDLRDDSDSDYAPSAVQDQTEQISLTPPVQLESSSTIKRIPIMKKSIGLKRNVSSKREEFEFAQPRAKRFRKKTQYRFAYSIERNLVLLRRANERKKNYYDSKTPFWLSEENQKRCRELKEKFKNYFVVNLIPPDEYDGNVEKFELPMPIESYIQLPDKSLTIPTEDDERL